MPGLTISSAYGAGGSLVAHQVADALGLELVDRAISAKVAEALHVTDEEAHGGAVRRSLVERFFGVLAPLSGISIGSEGRSDVHAMLPAQEPAAFRVEADRIIDEAIAHGAVIVGRAGAAALHERADVLRVRLFGPVEKRIAQAVRLGHFDEASARANQERTDRARAHYVHHLYGRDIDDPLLYHLQLDSTAIPLDGCADVIATAYRRFSATR